jgi:competence protein ComEC
VNGKYIFLILILSVISIRYWFRSSDDAYFSNLKMKGTYSVLGKIISEPDERSDSTRFTLQVSCISKTECNAQSDDEHLLLVKTDYSLIKYGDEVRLTGMIDKPGVIMSLDGSEFDYGSYLSKDDIFYIFTAKDIEVISHHHGSFILEKLYEFKQEFLQNLRSLLPSPHSFLAGGLVISGKGSLSKELQLEFQKVGLIHIVVLSGFNISIIGATIMSVLYFVPILPRVTLGAISIVLFSLMVGGGSTVMRSMIMSLIGLFTKATDRKNNALTSLIFAGLIMLVINPKILFQDPSFQMSFAATLGLILLSDPYEVLMRCLRCVTYVPKEIVSLVCATLATQTFTLPLILKFSGIISIVGLPVNIIILPAIPLTMLFVFLTAMFSFISSLLAAPFMFVSWILLSYELYIVHLGSSLSFSALILTPLTWKKVLPLYVLIIIFTMKLRNYVYMKYKSRTPS